MPAIDAQMILPSGLFQSAHPLTAELVAVVAARNAVTRWM
jgi:hypothetical protein